MSIRAVYDVYEPWADEPTVTITAALAATHTRYADTDATLTIDYSAELERAGFLDGPREVAMRLWKESVSDWVEFPRSRFWVQTINEDRRQDGLPRAHVLRGGGFHLEGGAILIGDVTVPEEGAVKPVRSFVDVTYGDILDTLLQELRDWTDPDAPAWAPGLTWSFTPTLDSRGMPYTGTAAGVTRAWDVGTPVMTVVHDAVKEGAIHWWFDGRELIVVDAATYSVDRTTDPGSVTIYDGGGITAVPETGDFSGLANAAVVMYAKGGTAIRVKADADTPYGTRFVAVSASGTDRDSAVDRAAHAALKIGKGLREEIQYQGTDAMHVPDPADPTKPLPPMPVLDCDVHELVRAQRDADPEAADPDELRINELYLVGIQLRFGPGDTKWTIYVNDKRKHAEVLVLEKLAALSKSSAGTYPPESPGPTDPRKPDTPAAPVVTFETYLTQAQHPRSLVRAYITPDLLETTHDNPEGIEEPIRIAAHGVERRRNAGDWKRVMTVPADSVLPVEDEGLNPDITWTYRTVQINRSGVESDPSLESAGSSPADADPRDRTNLVVDSHHVSTLRNAARVAATTGLSFVAEGSDTVAALAGTSAVVMYGAQTTAADTSGRFRVQAGEKVYAKARLKRVGFSGATATVKVFYAYDDGTTGTQTAATAITTGTYAEYGGVTSPTKDGYAEIRIGVDSAVGSGSVRVLGAYGARQAKTQNYEDVSVVNAVVADDANTSRTTHATDNLTSKHTSTAALFQAAAGSSGWKGGTSGLFFYDGAGLAFEATSAGVYIRGSLEAGGILIEDDVIDFGGAHTIAYTGSDLIFSAASGFEFNGAASFIDGVTFNQAITLQAGLTMNSGVSSFLNSGGARVNGSGTNLGFFGSSGGGKYTIDTQPITGAVSRDAVINSIRSCLQSYNVG